MAAQNIYQMYMENGFKFGYFVTRDSWSGGKYAMVVGIDGVKEGEAISGEPPYFTRYYPAGHPKEGKVWQRVVYLKASWFEGGSYEAGTGGTYAWKRVFPNQ